MYIFSICIPEKRLKGLIYSTLFCAFSLYYRLAHSTSTLLAKIRGAISEAIVAARSNLSSRREHKVLQPVDKI